jgi:hypothetical protein
MSQGMRIGMSWGRSGNNDSNSFPRWVLVRPSPTFRLHGPGTDVGENAHAVYEILERRQDQAGSGIWGCGMVP